MFNQLFNNIGSRDKSAALRSLIDHSAPSKDFFLFVILSGLMACLGLLIDSSAVIVGSMLIAPVLYPILSLAMGIVMSDSRMIARSFHTLNKSFLYVIGASVVVTLLFTYAQEDFTLTNEILARTNSNDLLYPAIAIVAGLAASFALVKPQLNETLPGIAISVALVPPLSVVGIGIARWELGVAVEALVLVGVNAVGIIFTSVIIFSLMNFYGKRAAAQKALKDEEKEMKKLEKKAKDSKD